MSDATLFERELYVEITVAWHQTHPRGSHVDRAFMALRARGRLCKLSYGQCGTRGPSTRGRDLRAGGLLAALALDRMRRVVDTQGVGRIPTDIFDPLCAWWFPLDAPRVLGVHYWELGSGILELRRLGKFDKPPALQFGRFAAERAERESAVMSCRPRGAGEPTRQR